MIIFRSPIGEFSETVQVTSHRAVQIFIVLQIVLEPYSLAWEVGVIHKDCEIPLGHNDMV